jgi:hypothetical protein
MRAALKTDARLLPFFISLPDDFICWHVGDQVRFFDVLPMFLITDRARQNSDESVSTAEVEKEYMQQWRLLMPTINQRKLIQEARATTITVQSEKQRLNKFG